MRANKEYSQTIVQTQKSLADLNEREADVIGENVLKFMDSIFTQEKLVESDL